MKEFRSKVAVITGGASGVGLALAHRLAREGANVVLADIEQEALDAAVEGLRATGAKAIGQKTDVVRREEVEALADRAFAEWGAVHMVFNNAGVGGGGGPTIWESPEKAFRWAMDVNYFGPLNGVLTFMPRLIAQGGEALIAATSSGAGIVFPPSSPAYSSSKAALIALWEVLAYQLQMAQSPIKAALLFPGPHVVDTGLFGSHRNLQSDYDDPLVREGTGINDIASFQAVMKMFLGREVDITNPADFAEEVFQSLLRDEFYILPLTDQTKAAVRKRYEDMLERRQPAIPDMM